MKSRHILVASAVLAAALLGGCNDDNSPRGSNPIVTDPTNPPTNPQPTMTISQLVASLIAMVTGSACNTATPTDINPLALTDDMTATDANTTAQNCAS